MSKFFYNVAIAVPLRQAFTYHSNQQIIPGTRVAVKFGRTNKLGIVTEVISETDIKTKPIYMVLDDLPIFSKTELKIFKWASDYYLHPIGEVINSFLPTNLRQIKNTFEVETIEGNKEIIEQNSEFETTLNSEQMKAVKFLNELKGFMPTLLHGVTGSGKTEVYIRCIYEQLLNKKSVLVLAPEIALTPQLESRVRNQFGDLVGIYHSKMTPSARYKAWKKFRSGELKVIIGTRSAVMMPAPKLGLIIVDEEHDASYKQQEGFKFSARDIAIKRAQIIKIPIILGSATPSLRTLKLVEEKKFQTISLTKRVTQKSPPKFSILDINEVKLVSGLAPQAIEAISQTLTQKKQAMIFINRRGFAPQFICSYCDWKAMCNSCDSSLVFHHQAARLICHRCDSAFGVPTHCPSCSKAQLSFLGTGTEQLEETLKELFPKTSIHRMDRDSTTKAGSLETILSEINNSDTGILIGTQMLIKGHDFSNLELVVTVDVDQGITSLNSSAVEEMGQQLIQVAGRAGRSDGNAIVLVQSRYVNDQNLLQLKSGDYLNFAKSLMEQRQATNQPPYTFEATIKASSPKAQTNIEMLTYAKQFIDSSKCVLIGPIPAMQSKVRGSYHHHLLIQAKTRTGLNKLLVHLSDCLSKDKNNTAKKVRWSINVDPLDF
jgi:primosomal protein N' (replication factor Y)